VLQDRRKFRRFHRHRGYNHSPEVNVNRP